MRLVGRLVASAVLPLTIAGCGSAGTKSAATVVRPHAGVVTVRPLAAPSPQPGGAHPAEPCWRSLGVNGYVHDVIGPDTPNPTCLEVSGGQRIEITNGTDRFGQRGHRLTVRVPSFPVVTLAPEQSVYFDAPVATYFARGGHTVAVAPAPGGPAVLVR